jgi:hypothetical protein
MIPPTIRLIFWLGDKLKLKFISKHKDFYYNFYSKKMMKRKRYKIDLKGFIDYLDDIDLNYIESKKSNCDFPLEFKKLRDYLVSKNIKSAKETFIEERRKYFNRKEKNIQKTITQNEARKSKLINFCEKNKPYFDIIKKRRSTMYKLIDKLIYDGFCDSMIKEYLLYQFKK